MISHSASDPFPTLLVGDYLLYLDDGGARLEQATEADRSALLTLDLDGLAVRECEPAFLSPILAALDAGQWSDVLRLGRELEPQVIQAGCWGTWARLIEQMRLAAHKLYDRQAQARALHQAGVRAFCLGDQAAARSLLANAFRLRQEIGDHDGAMNTCALLDLLLGPPMPSSSSAGPVPAISKRPLPLWAVLSPVLLLALIVLGGVLTLNLWRPTSTPESAWTSVYPPITSTPVESQVITPTFTPTFIVAPTLTPVSIPTHTPVPPHTPTSAATPDILGPSPPTLNQPAANAVLNCAADKARLSTRFQWGTVSDPSGIKRYELSLTEIAPRIYAYPVKTFTDAQPVEVELLCGKTYRWRVRAVDGVGNPGGWSEERQFTLADKTPPSAPTLSAPADAIALDCPSGRPVDVLLKWAAVSDPSGIARYEIEVVRETPTLTQDIYSVAGTQPEIPLSASCDQTYTWRVRATDGVGNVGAWSSPRRFQIKPPPPDLVIDELQTTGVAQILADGRVHVPIRFTVHNRGGSDADLFNVAVIYTPESAGPPQWFLLEFIGPTASDQPLPADTRLTFSGTVAFESIEQGKTIDLQIIADACLTESDMPAHCRVSESDEGNNRSALLRLTLPRLITATLRPAADATVDRRLPTRVYGTADLLVVDGGEYTAEALIRFDLNSIPPAAEIRSATLYLSVNPQWSLTDTAVTIEIAQVQEAWAEETVNWDNKPTYAPLDPSIQPTCTLTVGTAGCRWEIAHWIQEWIAGQPHWGIVLRSQDGRRAFFSRESANAPRLVVEYLFVPAYGVSERGQSGWGLRP